MATKTTKTSDAEVKDGEEAGKGGRGKLKLIVMLLPTILLVVAALVYFLFLRPSSDAAPEEEPPPEPGIVIVLDPVTINLASGHYLKLGMTLQATKDVAEALDGSKALDAAIDLYSGMSIEEIADTQGRESTKHELIEKVGEAYEGEIYDIYFTSFVYQ